MSSNRQTILFVDDEPAVLEGFQRLLHNEFEIEVAMGGPAALRRIEAAGPYAVIVADMRMPDMNGIELLELVKVSTPDTVRVMLTGTGDMDTAISAVNEGSIFRFLTKPADKETLSKALAASLAQYRLITSEKELLEKTLSGTIKVLMEVLSLVNPAAFSRATRILYCVQYIVKKLGLPTSWKFEVAAMMSQLGCVTVDPEIVEAVYAGQKLDHEEQTKFDAHPAVARDLLSSIPRMEPIAWIIAQQCKPAPIIPGVSDPETLETIRLGVNILRAALEFDRQVAGGTSTNTAIHTMNESKNFNPEIVQALIGIDLKCDRVEVRTCRLKDLSPGMILHQEIRTGSGMLLVAKGQEITYPLIMRLKSFRNQQSLPEEIRVAIPHASNTYALAGK